MSESTDSRSSWQLITKWIDECVDNRVQCGGRGDCSWKPTRLLDLGQDATQLKPHLILSKEHFMESSISEERCRSTSSEHYMTLSHCWGSNEILRLLRGNLDSLCKSIRLESLPKTFKDAMRITRDLGIRYLWIDSLCIIQDSPDDWLQEAAAVSYVYKNSFCNIAATGAADGSQGCFFSRNPNTISAPRFNQTGKTSRARRMSWFSPSDISSPNFLILRS